jgi:hypothetical protein
MCNSHAEDWSAEVGMLMSAIGAPAETVEDLKYDAPNR